MNIFTTDFEQLERNEKTKMYHNFSKYAEESFKNYSEKTQVLAQLLFLNRVYNSYSKAIKSSDLEESRLMRDSIDTLWRYLEGNLSREEVIKFANGINATCLYINIGDDSEINEDIEFRDKYFRELEKNTNYLVLLNSLASVYYQMYEKSFDWYAISEDCILGELRDIIDEHFEYDIYGSSDKSCKIENYEVKTSKICNSKIFKKIILYLLKDLRQAIDINEGDFDKFKYLHKQYQSENIFTDDECKKISEYFM